MNKPSDEALLSIGIGLPESFKFPNEQAWHDHHNKWMHVGVRLKCYFSNSSPFPDSQSSDHKVFDEYTNLYVDYLVKLWYFIDELFAQKLLQPLLKDNLVNLEDSWLKIIFSEMKLDYIRSTSKYLESLSSKEMKSLIKLSKDKLKGDLDDETYINKLQKIRDKWFKKKKANIPSFTRIEAACEGIAWFDNLIDSLLSEQTVPLPGFKFDKLYDLRDSKIKLLECSSRNAKGFTIINGCSVVNPSGTGRKPKPKGFR